MIRKTTAYLFIILANIVLLGHAVIPHHHHEQQLCIKNKYCQNDAKAHHHESSEKDHQHDGKNAPNCILKQLVILPSNQGRNECNCFTTSEDHEDDFQFILFTNNFESNYFVFSNVSSKIHFTPHYSAFLIPSSGLRAPPTV